LDAAPGLKYRAILSLAYGAGLRASEVVSLKLADIDSSRMVIRVEQGKGRKDRYAMLSQPLLDLLRAWWMATRQRGVMLPGGRLFPGQNPVNPLEARPIDEPDKKHLRNSPDQNHQDQGVPVAKHRAGDGLQAAVER
jgi:integrase